MQTVNGKLINIERGQLDIVRRQTGDICKRCENLQQQLNSLKQANEDKNKACLQEINAVRGCFVEELTAVKVYLIALDKKLTAVEELTTIKAYLVTLNKKLTAVEEVAAKQAKSLMAVKFYSFWSLAFISFLLGMSIQMNWNKEQPQKHAQNVQTRLIASLHVN